jgi:hypothetical protein
MPFYKAKNHALQGVLEALIQCCHLGYSFSADELQVFFQMIGETAINT